MKIIPWAGHESDIKHLCLRLQQGFGLLFSDKNAFKALILRGLKFRSVRMPTEKIVLLEHGYFSKEMFEALISGGDSYVSNPISFLWERLVHHGIVSDISGALEGALAGFLLNQRLLQEHLKFDTFLNLFAPPASLASRYASSIVAIDVDKDGSSCRGSGFIIQPTIGETQWIVTCRHNVDPVIGIKILCQTTADGRDINCGPALLSNDLDLAFIPILEAIPGPFFPLMGAVEMFDEVYTFGFPSVPGAQPTLVGHRGEVNGFAEHYLLKCSVILISNLVSPGSSGCPVTLADGRCAGMTISWLEGKTLDGPDVRFSAAISSDAIQSEFHKIVQAG